MVYQTTFEKLVYQEMELGTAQTGVYNFTTFFYFGCVHVWPSRCWLKYGFSERFFLFHPKKNNVRIDKCFICLILGTLMTTKQYNMSWLCGWFTSSTEKN